MIETATLITLCMLFLIFFRPGKTPALENPLVIERPGQYLLTLAPQLNLAQPFAEGIAARLLSADRQDQSSETQYFEVRDPLVVAHGFEFYLLAITLRNGIWFFQAARPLSHEPDEQFATLYQFAHGVLSGFPDEAIPSADWAKQISTAANDEAKARKILLKQLA